MIKYAEVYLDMDENRTVWQVGVFDEDDNLLEMRPFRDRQDAEEYAELFAKQKSGTITDKERERQGKLVALIGQGYQKLRNESEIPGYRSTPTSTGESRSSSAYTCGG